MQVVRPTGSFFEPRQHWQELWSNCDSIRRLLGRAKLISMVVCIRSLS